MFNSEVCWIYIYIYKGRECSLNYHFCSFLQEEKGLLLPNDPLTYAPFVTAVSPSPSSLRALLSQLHILLRVVCCLHLRGDLIRDRGNYFEGGKCQGKYGSNSISNYSQRPCIPPHSVPDK